MTKGGTATEEEDEEKRTEEEGTRDPPAESSSLSDMQLDRLYMLAGDAGRSEAEADGIGGPALAQNRAEEETEEATRASGRNISKHSSPVSDGTTMQVGEGWSSGEGGAWTEADAAGEEEGT